MCQREPTFSSYLNVKELLAQNRHHIWNLSDCKETHTHKHLVRKQTLNYLAKLAKWSVRYIWLYFLIMSCKHFWANLDALVAWISRNSLLETGALSETEFTVTGVEPTTPYFVKKHWTIWENLSNFWDELWVYICTVHLTLRFNHVMHLSHTKSTRFSRLNVEELLA